MGFIQEEWPFMLCISIVILSCVAGGLVVYRYEAPLVRRNKSRTRKDEFRDEDDQSFLSANQLFDSFSGKFHLSQWLCAFRIIAFVYLLLVQVINLVMENILSYLFYTQWTFTLLVLYFGLASWLSLKEVVKSRQPTSPSDEEVGDGLMSENKVERPTAGVFGYVVLIIFQVVVPASVLTDATYWCILVPLLPDRFNFNFININMHAVNAVFLLGEFFLNDMPFPWFRGAYFVFWTATYVIFQWIIHGTGLVKWWPYPFLEVQTQYAPAWYFGMAVGHFIVFLLCLALAKAKKALKAAQAMRN